MLSADAKRGCAQAQPEEETLRVVDAGRQTQERVTYTEMTRRSLVGDHLSMSPALKHPASHRLSAIGIESLP